MMIFREFGETNFTFRTFKSFEGFYCLVVILSLNLATKVYISSLGSPNLLLKLTLILFLLLTTEV